MKLIFDTGSFTDWKSSVSLRRSPENQDHVRSIALLPGTYQVRLAYSGMQFYTLPAWSACLMLKPVVQYKYKVDGQWLTSPCEAIIGDGTVRF